jgi:comEA protein
LWNVESHQSVSLPSEQVYSIAFSPDSKTLALEHPTAVTLWDVATHHLIGQALPLPTDEITGNYAFRLAFSSDGKTLTSVRDEMLIVWDVNPDAWVEKTCQRAGRNLTREEWVQYFPNENYRATCSHLTPNLVASSALSVNPLATVDASRLININVAPLEELIILPGIGFTTAQRIIDYRQQNGPFSKIEDIINVPGIGPGVYERIKNLITVGS